MTSTSPTWRGPAVEDLRGASLAPLKEALDRWRGRASDAAETKNLILNAAALVFSDRGYTKASISDIAAIAGLTKGAVYWHFASKEDMGIAVVAQMYSSWPQMLADVTAQHDDVLTAITAIVRAAARQFREDPITQAAKRLLAELGRDALARLPQPYVGWEKALAALLAEGLSRGQVAADVDPVATARVLVSSFFGMQQVSLELTGRSDLEERVEEFLALILPRLSPRL